MSNFDSNSSCNLLTVIFNYLQPVHRGVMARTKDKYILMDVTSTTDKAVTGILIVLTMCGILLLFWYQNFGPGIKIGSQIHS